MFKRISILDRIERRMLFAFAKLTELNNEYHLCCEIYSNNICIVQDIRIFSNDFKGKNEGFAELSKKLCFMKMPSVLTIIN